MRPCLAIVALLFFTACQNTGIAPDRAVHITIGGATAMHPVLEELTTEFHRRTPTAYFELQGGGSTYGEEQTLVGRINLGASTLPPPQEENTSAPEARSPGPINPNPTRIPIGIDALALIVHASNPVEMLSTEQVALIYEGKILDWVEVGGPSGEVALASREEGSGARHIFEERMMAGNPVALTAVVMPTSRDVVEYVAKTPNAIGYVSRAHVIDRLPDRDGTGDGPSTEDASARVKIVGLEGHWPVDAAIQNQLYLLSYPVYLVSRREPTGTVRRFVDFALSPAGQTIVGRYHVRVR